jgi:hypothetical protein
VGDGDGRALVGGVFEGLLHQSFACGVQGAGGLIEDEDSGVFK